MKIIGIIQAHSKGWGGGKDSCLNKINNEYVISNVIHQLKQIEKIEKIVIAVPDVPENEIFKKISNEENVRYFFGSTSNVLDRFIKAAEFIDGDIIVRVLGQHYFFDPNLIENMIVYLLNNDYDFVQTPDDFDCKLSGEIFTLDALKREMKMLKNMGVNYNKYMARPFTFIRENESEFKVGIYENIPKYSKKQLEKMRKLNMFIINEHDDFIDGEGCEFGDFNNIRYQTILPYINKDDLVLDIACGSGYGSKLIAEHCKTVVGVDVNSDVIDSNKTNYYVNNLSFLVGDALKLKFDDNVFDKIVSMETIEHIRDDFKYLCEMYRILKPQGLFIVSTPQNKDGTIPLNPWHIREYSLEKFRDILTDKFEVSKIYVAKRGIITDDEKGDNMIAICRKI